MGNCVCAPRNSLEFILNDIWNESDITKISPESYHNFFKRFLEAEKDITNVDEQDQQIYSSIITSQNNKEFYSNLKNDIIFMCNNGKLHIIMLALIFFTKINNGNNLSKSIERLFSIVKLYFNTKYDIQTDKEFFVEILETYILICSQLSLKYVNKSEMFRQDNMEKDYEMLKKFYEKKYRDLLIKKYLDGEDFFFMSKFIQENIEKLYHANIRDELRIIYFDANK